MAKRSILSNARMHCGGRDFVATVDLLDFFGTIRLERVQRIFEQLGTPAQVALTLARLCTYQGALPQGTRCSPALANLAAASLDMRILANAEGWHYSRYVDDLTFSGPRVPTLKQLEQWARLDGFQVRPGSFLLRGHGSGQYVTGLFVEGDRPRISRHLRRRVARFFYWANNFEPVSAAQVTFGRHRALRDIKRVHAYINGLISWVEPIDESLAVEWRDQLNRVSTPKEVGVANPL